MKHELKLMKNEHLRLIKKQEVEELQKVGGWGVQSYRSEISNLNRDSTSDRSAADSDFSSYNNNSSYGKKVMENYSGKQQQPRKTNVGSTPQNIPDNLVSCNWEVTQADYSCAEPGFIGFNGHQAVFHCFKPGQPYLARNACTDSCVLKLGTMPSGDQVCSIIYEKPPPPPFPLTRPKRRYCQVDQSVTVDLDADARKKALSESGCQTSDAGAPPEGPGEGEGKKGKGKGDKKEGKGKGGKKGGKKK